MNISIQALHQRHVAVQAYKWSVSKIGRQHIWNSILDGIDFIAGLTAELGRHYLVIIFFKYLYSQLSFAQWTGQNIKKIAFHWQKHLFSRSINIWSRLAKMIAQMVWTKIV